MESARTKIDASGRVAIPAEHLRALGLREGDTVIMRVEDGELRIISIRQALRRAQEIVRKYVPADRSLADELFAERREEAARE
jgi:AbrB family looped-hinge helix DNA binding protein